jgi:predicted metal-dependent phosphotriesterase family hydrolase
VDQREDPTGDTFDYGLAPGETFEPETLDDIDRGQPHIMTVLGPVEPGALGVTNPAASFATPTGDPAAILDEIEEAGFVGLNALVHLAPLTTAAEAEQARWLAGRCDLHLIVTTGDTPADAMQSAAATGIAGTGVFPGAIVTTAERDALRAAHQAHVETGLPLIVQVDGGATGEALLSRLAETGIDPAHVTVAGFTPAPEPLLAAGATLLALLSRRDDAPAAAMMIAGLVKQQWTDRIMVGFDPQPRNDSVSYGEGSRWSWLIEQFPLMLLEAGLDAMTVRAVMIENPNRALTIHPPAAAGTSEEHS